MAIYENYTSAAAHTVISKEDKRTGTGYSGDIKKILISNNSANSATVGAYLDDDSKQHYFCKNVVVPSGASLVLEDNVSFDSRLYDLKIKNSGTSPSISVIVSYG